MSARREGHVLRAVVTVVRVLLIASFLLAAFGKFSGDPHAVAMFEALGVGQWMRYVTGTVELIGAVLLTTRRTRLPGAVLLAGVMAGAFLSHLGPVPGNALVPLTLLACIAVVAWSEVRASGGAAAVLAHARSRRSARAIALMLSFVLPGWIDIMPKVP